MCDEGQILINIFASIFGRIPTSNRSEDLLWQYDCAWYYIIDITTDKDISLEQIIICYLLKIASEITDT